MPTLEEQEGRKLAKTKSEEEARRKALLEEISREGYTQTMEAQKREVQELEELYNRPSPPEQAVIVPDVRGMVPAKAKAALEKLGFRTYTSTEQSPEVKAPIVRTLQPTPGTEAVFGQTVSLVVLIPITEEGREKEDDQSRDDQSRYEQSRKEDFDNLQNEESARDKQGELSDSDQGLMEQEEASQSRLQDLKEGVREQAKEVAKQELKKVAEKELEAAAEEVIVSTAPYWAPVVLAILGIIIAVFLAIIAVVGVCNQDEGWTGDIARFASTVAGVLGIAPDVCDLVKLPNTYVGGPKPVGPSTSTTDEQTARDYLAAAGIGVNKLCTDKTQLINDPPGQTCLEGMKAGVLDELVFLKANCDAWIKTQPALSGICNVTVTGGTEPGHAVGACSHGTGDKVDIRLDANLDKYIQTTFAAHTPRPNPPNPPDPVWVNTVSTSFYTKETNHWDVSVGCF